MVSLVGNSCLHSMIDRTFGLRFQEGAQRLGNPTKYRALCLSIQEGAQSDVMSIGRSKELVCCREFVSGLDVTSQPKWRLLVAVETRIAKEA